MRPGLKRKLIGGTELRVRVEHDHSPDCTDVRDGDVLWVDDGHRWLDSRGGNRSHHRRWLLFRCNGVSSAEHGDERRFCAARILVEPFKLSGIINVVLDGGL